ncbi:GerMN domain-containing protein [Acidobacteriota bacterium]
MHDKRVLAGVIGLLTVFMLALVYLNFIRGPSETPASETPSAGPDGIQPGSPPRGIEELGPTYRATLYFEGEDTDLLYPEIREIESTGSELVMIRQTVEELISGPSRNLLPIVPEGTRLLDLFLMPEGLLCLNFSQEIRSGHEGGTSAELRTIYGIVDTVAINYPKIKAVQFLIEGRQVTTLAGHVSIRKPIHPDWDLLNLQ